MTLYDLTEEFRDLLEIAEDPTVDPVTLEDTFEAIGGEIENKAEGYGMVIKQMEHDIAVIKTELKRLSDKKGNIEKNIDRMKKVVQGAMELIGERRIETPLFNFVIQKNPAAVVMDSEEVPAEYLIAQEPKIDRAKIREDLKAGKDLHGVAHLEQSETLRIK